MTATDIDDLAKRLSGANALSGQLFVAALRELAKGRPVSVTALADALGWRVAQVIAALEQAPTRIDFDEDGSLVGYGLTLRETVHVFEIEGCRLHTWCALDALMFPALIGKTARVSSRCAATGELVSMTVGPQAVQDVAPRAAVVSLVLPKASADLRRSFSCNVHFFVSVEAADGWALAHAGAQIVGVEEAFALGQEIARQIARNAEPPQLLKKGL